MLVLLVCFKDAKNLKQWRNNCVIFTVAMDEALKSIKCWLFSWWDVYTCLLRLTITTGERMNRPSGGPSNGCFLKTSQKVHGFPATSPKLSSSAALLLDFLLQCLIISISFLINPIFINTKPWYQLTTYSPTSRIWCPICILACVSWALRLVRMAQRRKHELFRDGPRRVDRNETSRPVGWTTIIHQLEETIKPIFLRGSLTTIYFVKEFEVVLLCQWLAPYRLQKMIGEIKLELHRQLRRCRRAKRFAGQLLFHKLSRVNLLASSKERGLAPC